MFELILFFMDGYSEVIGVESEDDGEKAIDMVIQLARKGVFKTDVRRVSLIRKFYSRQEHDFVSQVVMSQEVC